MLKETIRSLLSTCGYELHRSKAVQPRGCDLNFCRMSDMVRPYTMLSEERLYSLYLQAAHCERSKIDGAFVECGVWKGGAVALMALTNLEMSRHPRHIHLFDAFDDICTPDASIDGERAVREATQWTSTPLNASNLDGSLTPLRGFYDSFGGAGSVAENRALMEKVVGYPADHLHFHEGWFQDTVPTAATKIGQIAILRIDGDWYASTKVCLDYLFDQVVAGGFVIVDDYGAYDGCRKAVEEFLERTGRRLFPNRIDEEAVYFIVP